MSDSKYYPGIKIGDKEYKSMIWVGDMFRCNYSLIPYIIIVYIPFICLFFRGCVELPSLTNPAEITLNIIICSLLIIYTFSFFFGIKDLCSLRTKGIYEINIAFISSTILIILMFIRKFLFYNFLFYNVEPSFDDIWGIIFMFLTLFINIYVFYKINLRYKSNKQYLIHSNFYQGITISLMGGFMYYFGYVLDTILDL